MEIPPSSDPRWKKIVNGDSPVRFRFLAANILLGRLHLLPDEERTQAIYDKFARDLRDLLTQNAQLPSVQSDVEALFN